MNSRHKGWRSVRNFRRQEAFGFKTRYKSDDGAAAFNRPRLPSGLRALTWGRAAEL
jgi:hypothetical protein